MLIQEVEDMIGIEATDAVRASAKNGLGVEDILEAVILRKVPPPERRGKWPAEGADHRLVV
jgi:GTP-binding protein LepA